MVPNVTILRLRKLIEQHQDLLARPERLWLVRSWGRGAGRKFVEPQANGTLVHYKDNDATHQYASWSDFLSQTSPDTFFVFVLSASSNGVSAKRGPTDRTHLRQRWLQEWQQLAPHSFDPKNSVTMNVYKNEHCIPILNRIYAH